jgi:hypothetical protein
MNGVKFRISVNCHSSPRLDFVFFRFRFNRRISCPETTSSICVSEIIIHATCSHINPIISVVCYSSPQKHIHVTSPRHFNFPHCILSLTAAALSVVARTSETSVDNYFTRQYIPENKSELHTRRRENLKSHSSP